MSEKIATATGVSLGSVTAHGREHHVIFVHADEFAIPNELHLMLPMGGLGIPVSSCSTSGTGLLCYPLAADLTPVDNPWRIDLPGGLWDVFNGVAKSTGGRYVLSARSDIPSSSTPLLVELAGALPSGPDRTDDAVLFDVGLWLASTQLAAESGDGFAHTRVAAGLAATSPTAAESLQYAIANALSSLTADGKTRLLDVPLPKVVNGDIVRLIVAGVPIYELFSQHGSARTTIAGVWVLALLSRLLVDRNQAHGHSVATLLAEWIGTGSPWWMWRATTIALASYEDAIPVSVLESTAGGATGALFWWLHELAGRLRSAEQSRGRLEVVSSLRKAELRPHDARLPLMDFSHALLAPSPNAGESSAFCGIEGCESCSVTRLTLRSPWQRGTLAKCAVWSVLLMSDLYASWDGFSPGDEEWARQRRVILGGFTENVGSRMALANGGNGAS